MPRFKYTQAMLSFLRATWTEYDLEHTTSLFNFTFGTRKSEAQIKSALKNHSIKCGRTHGEINKGKLRSFTNEQKAWIEKQYRVMSISALTAEFNFQFCASKTEKQIRAFTRNHSIKSGRTGRFESGHETWNKGTNFCAGGNAAKTRFKKGHIPANHKPIGSERIDTKDGYVMVKVAEPRTWRLKHIVVWEQHNGKLPDGHVIWFIDNDRTNCSIENLMLVTQGENAVTNKFGLGRAAPQDKTTVQLIAKTRIKARERRNNL
ncbi:HNH endonuclease signature motif containing protein [Shewanella fodinae]|uniref:HNH endonuclease signature motif containing protein n=1 Tax=Shewanella fodinae TaxID=552357 RepID=UPI00167A6246|nr:HNH endonuclease signature motif containing protein [Shewanella fodinae]MCL2905176.1 HNH endonuclease [Shewanella fodinae]GGY87995.1 hypothetical protein GCM10007169_01480 [Shewanella fodinae]